MLRSDRWKLHELNLMCSRSFLVVLALSVGVALAQSGEERVRPSVAVCYFEDLSAPPLGDSALYQKLFATLYVRCLETLDVFDVADRTRVQEAIDSLKLAAFGILESEQIGKMVGARYMLLGDFQAIGNEKFILNVRLLDMTNGRLVPGAADNAMLALSEVSDFCQETARKTAKALDLSASKSARANLKKVGSSSVDALRALGTALVSRDAKGYEEALVNLDRARKLDPDFAELDRQRTEIEALIELREKARTGKP